MAHHHFHSPRANNASGLSPDPAGRDEERAALRAKRIIEFGLLALNVLLTEFMPSSLSIPTLTVSNIARYPVVDVKLHDNPPPTAMAREILAAHNRYRVEFGVLPMQWFDDLANHAVVWAKRLAAENAFGHANTKYYEGECLWMGTAGYYSYTHMVDSFGKEKQYYIPGVFPDVSKTKNWKDVGHYTQIVWARTTHVGCAGATGSDGNYRLVCRYSPQGNVTGQRVK